MICSTSEAKSVWSNLKSNLGASCAGAGGSRERHAAAGAPGPADHMLTLPVSVRVFVARGATDLRRSFDRLSAQVQEVLRQEPVAGHVFVFFNRQSNRVKLLE